VDMNNLLGWAESTPVSFARQQKSQYLLTAFGSQNRTTV
jgi:hypothetical protein